MNRKPFSTGFIGAGNMGTALIAGLIRGGLDPHLIAIAEPDDDRAKALQSRFPGIGRLGAGELAEQSQTLVLAVKPQILGNIAPGLANAVARTQPLVVSVAAGITIERLQGWLGLEARIVRAMPNTPALIGAGITGVHAGKHATEQDRTAAEQLLGAVGQVVWLQDEEQMHAVTAISGSGPAYAFLLMEAMTEAARSLGLDPDTASRLTLATVAGSARLAQGSAETPAELRARVTSPGGTTERAVAVFEQRGFRALVSDAIHAAAQRSRELAS